MTDNVTASPLKGINTNALCLLIPSNKDNTVAGRSTENMCHDLFFLVEHRLKLWGTVLSHPQFSSVTQSCLTLCDPMYCSTPGLPVHHQLPEVTQTHVHWVGDAIQPSYPLSSPSPLAFNLSQRQSLFQRVSSSHQVAKVLEFSASASVLPMNTRDWSPLGWTGWISL